MSPIGGVGINLAIQDAVAAANILAAPLRAGSVTVRDLAAVQRRRTFPVRVIQAFQVFMQNTIFRRALGLPASSQQFPLPLPFRLLRRVPYLRRFPAQFIGIGVRPEHVRTPELVTPRSA